MGRPPFTRVLPDETELYGAVAAIVLAHIRFRCESDGPGRYERGGFRWWRTSYGEIGRELGLSPSQVERAMTKLANSVAVAHHPPLEDQTRSYRPACDLPVPEIGRVVTSQNTKSGETGPISGGTGPKTGGDRPEIGSCTTTGDTGEVGEIGEGAPSRRSGTALGPHQLNQLFSNDPRPRPQAPPTPEVIDAEVVSEDAPYGRCELCKRGLDERGVCGRCYCTNPKYRRWMDEEGIA